MKQTQSCLQVPQLVTTKLSALQSAVADWNQSCRTLPSSANNPFGMASPNTLVDQASGQAHQIASMCAQGSNCAATLKQFVSHIENDVNPLLKNGCDDPTYYGSKFKLQTQMLQNEAQNACTAPFASMQWGAMNIADTIQFYGASSVSLDTLCQVSWQTRCPDKRVISWTRTKSAPPWGNKTKTFNFHFRYCYENPDVTTCDNMSPTGVSIKISHFTDFSAIAENKNLTIDINMCCLHSQCDAMADTLKASLPNDH